MKTPDVITIVADRLRADGYDGLFSPDECACLLDDLEPCGEVQGDCRAGYKTECRCGEGCDFDVSEDPPKNNEEPA